MRIELIIFVIAAAIMANIYTEGKYLSTLLSYKKYYQMAGVAVVAFMLFWLFRKNPTKAHEMLSASNDYIKYLPVDKNTSSFISPILDFTTKQNIAKDQYYGGTTGYNHPVVSMNQPESRISESGKKATKRSVSETKKKYVASSQNWKCGGCQKQLNAWFEVDHTIRLEHGGSNHIDNLVALCRECHGKKTTMENL
uniref:HNH nuclease domain-containing protein n=1 Tax=viral metagenome TaxID=1070528 RepID=A0A6C0DQF5_9ZZZZ